MNEFIDGFIQGAKEGPFVFALPLIALARLLSDTLKSVTGR